MNDKLPRIVSIGSVGTDSRSFVPRRCPLHTTPAVAKVHAAFLGCHVGNRIARASWAIVASLLLLGLGGCHHGATGDDREDAEKAGVTVRIERAQERLMIETVDGLGRCEALPDKIAALTPAVEGRVFEILVQPSTEVKAGQPILQLDPTIARADLQEKITSRKALEASLRLLETPPRLQEQEGRKLTIESAKAALAKAEAAAQRLRPLHAREEISEQQMFEAELAVTQARLQLQTAESELAVFVLAPRPAAIEEAKTHVAVAAAAVDSAQAKVDLHTIRAPIAGVVDAINCRLGQTLAVGTAIGEIVDSRQLYAAVWLPTDVARRVQIGQEAIVRAGSSRQRTAAFSANEDTAQQPESLPGKVSLLNRIADPQTGNLLVRVLVDNPHGSLVVGETVHVTIVIGHRDNVLAVPVAAVNDLGEGPVVHVVREGKTVMLASTARNERRRLDGSAGYRSPVRRTGDCRGRLQSAGRNRGQRGPGRDREQGSMSIDAGRQAETEPHGPRRNLVALARPYFGLIVLATLLLTGVRRGADAAHAQRHLSRSGLSADHRHRANARPGGEERRNRRHAADRRGREHRAGRQSRAIEDGPRRRARSTSISRPAPT